MQASEAQAAASAKRTRSPSKPQPLHAAQVADALLALPTVSAITGLSTATIYRKAASDPNFPKLIRLSARCTRVRAGDLTAWMAAQAGKTPAVEA